MSDHRRPGRFARRLRKSPALITAAILAFGVVPTYFATSASAAVGAGDITTFPAANITIDSGGPNDINSDQVDLTQMGNDPTHSPYRLFWSWAKTDWTGNNTGNACALLDQNGDNKVDQAVCAIVGNGGGKPGVSVNQVGTPTLYDCNNHFSDRCGNPAPVVGASVHGGVVGSSPFDETGNLITNTDPWVANGPNSTIEVQIDQAHLTAKTLLNVCSYPSNGNGGNNNPFDCVVDLGSSIGLTKTASSANVNVGDAVTYTLVATNTGISTLSNVSITDTGFTPAPSLTCKINNAGADVTPPVALDPGDTLDCTFSHTFNSVPAGGSFTNTAKTQGTDSTGKTVSATAQAIVNVAAVATGTVTVTKHVTGAAPVAGGTFDIDVTCGGTTTHMHLAANGSQNVTGLAPNTSCSVNEGGVNGADSTTYTLDTLNYTANSSFTVAGGAVRDVVVTNHYNGATIDVSKTVTGNPPAGLGNFDIDVTCGGVTTTKHVAAGGSDSVTGIPEGTSCSVTESGAQGADSTTYTKNGAPYTGTSFVVTNNTTYTVAVTNHYNGGTIHVTKTVTGSPPAGLAAFDIDVTCGATVTHLHVAGGGSADVTGIPGGSSCSATEVATQGASSTNYTLDGGAYTAGTTFSVANGATHTVAVTNDYAAPLPPPVPGTPNLTLAKSSLPASGGTVQPGDSITYTLAYANTGTGAANGALTSDPLPADTTFVSATSGGSYDAATNTVSWALGTISPGASGSVSFVVQVAKTATDGEVITNVGSLAAAGVAAVSSNPVTVTVTVPATPTPTLQLAKTVDKSNAEFGDTLTYGFTVVAGGTGQTGVIVTDSIPAGTDYVANSATCSTGCSASLAGGVLTWNVGNLAQGASVDLSFKVTISTPNAAADGGIPQETIHNIGLVNSHEVVDPVESNRVTTDVTAVLGITHHRQPPQVQPVHHDRLPFTGMPYSLAQLLMMAAMAIGVGSLLVHRARGRRALEAPVEPQTEG